MSGPYAEVIGDPVAHSKSPLIHNFWLGKLGLSGDFRALRVTASGLPAYFERRRRDPEWRGCSITRPHKTDAIAHLDTVARHAGDIGAVNAVRHGDDGRLHGRNTDVHGIWRSLDHILRPDLRVVLVGAGDAARAAAFAVRAHKPRALTVINRSPARAHKLLNDLRMEGVVSTRAEVPPADLLINACAGPPPIDLSALDESAVVFDMVYEPVVTPLLRAAAARGLRTVNGIVMLVNQASEAFSIFFERAPPHNADRELMELLTR